MADRTLLRSGHHYRLVRISSGPRLRQGAAIYHIEDLGGQLICHCGASQLEADKLFEALERPRRPGRAEQPVAVQERLDAW